MLEHGKNVYRTPAVNRWQETEIALAAAEALAQDDALAQTIARGAHDLAINVLTTRNIELFMLALLRRYAKLMDFRWRCTKMPSPSRRVSWGRASDGLKNGHALCAICESRLY